MLQRSTILLLCVYCLWPSFLSAQQEVYASFEENKGRFPKHIAASAEIPGGMVFVENKGFTFHFLETDHHIDAHKHDADERAQGHAIRMQFEQAGSPSLKLSKPLPGSSNYYLGNDPKNWSPDTKSYRDIAMNELYPGIHWLIGSNAAGLKYDFIVDANASPHVIQMRWAGANKIKLKNGDLIISTSLGDLIEKAPTAWQIIDGKKQVVSCKFKLSDDLVSFDLGNYDTSHELIIDPLLVFGSFSGSSADNWGFTATYDNAGNTYSAGVVFGIGYPTTTGAYQTSFAGGSGSRPGDIGIIKFGPSGDRIFATYLGGSNNELPQSLIVSSANELFLFGTTGSSDFPTTSGAWSRDFSGGTEVSILRGGITFTAGTDLFVCRLSENGQQLLASTFIGGSGNDGLNTANQLRYNYADDARGGIIIDEQNNVYVGCSTSSSDFPVPGNAYQASYGGGSQDGMIVKFNLNLSTLFWGTYLGGSSADGVMSLTLDQQGQVYVAGGTTSLDFPLSGTPYQSVNGGAQSDGFIAALSPNGQNLLHSTYYGTDAYDQIFLISASRENGIYVYGQTEKGGTFYQEGFSFSEPNGKQFVSRFSPDLSSRVWSTSFGNGLAKPDITPSAFTVDICGQLFICGWGGASNSSPDGGTFGGTSGLTVTADAFQSTTDNNDFYLMVLDEMNQSLEYATFFGGATSSEHVDGGTSRFDRRGVVHQAVCAGCGGRDDFPTTTNAWSTVNGSNSGCNNAVFKFDFELPSTVASFTGPPIGCVPFEASFSNTSSYAESYTWTINGNSFSTNEQANFTFSNPGLYTIQLIANNPNSCNVVDTFTRQIRIVNSTYDIFDSLSVCYLSPVQIGIPFPVDPYYQVQWTPELGLNDPNAQQAIATPEVSTNYVLYLSLASCADTIEQFVGLRLDEIDAGLNLSICRGQTVEIGLPGDTSLYEYQWSPAATLNFSTIDTPLASVDETTWFQLLRIPKDTALGCPGRDSLQVFIPEGAPLADFDTEVLATCTDVKVQVTNLSELANESRWEFAPGFSSDSLNLNPQIVFAYGDTIRITLYVENDICRDTLEFVEPLKSLDEYYKINNANAFSPNGDGQNECFSPALQDLPAPDDKNFLYCSELHVFDRWGLEVFDSTKGDEGCWDGKSMQGVECPAGTYVYLFEGQGQKIQGTVTLMR